MGMYLLLMATETISLLFLSRAGGEVVPGGARGSSNAEIAGLGLGNLVYNCAALAVGFGFTGSQDTLVTQAYGRGRHDLCELYLHRCQVWMFAVTVACGSVVVFTEPLLLLLRACDEETALHAGTYTRLCALGLPGLFQYSALRKFLMAQKLPRPSLWVQCASVPLHVAWCALLVPSRRIQGVGIAMALKSWTDLCLLGLYASISNPRPGCRDWWRFWRALRGRRRWDGLQEYLWLALPVVAMMAVEWWAFEMLSLAVGYFHSREKLAAHVTAVNVASILYLAGTGAQKATATLVGGAVGRGDEASVRRFFRAALEWNCGAGALMGLAVVVLRGEIAVAFAPNSPGVQDLLMRLLPLLAVQGVIDGVNQVMQGALQGFGLQNRASRVSLLCYWGIQLPVALTFGFPLGLGVPGLWLGCIFCSTVAFVLNTSLFCRASFSEASIAARARMEADTSRQVSAEDLARPLEDAEGGDNFSLPVGSSGGDAIQPAQACKPPT